MNHDSTEKPPGNPLEHLLVIDRMEIGPVRMENRRLTAPFKVVRGKREETAELIYRYGEDVFNPGDGASQNLADIVAAQVALNYGLFCSEMVFHGTYEPIDRSFLLDMAQNTAREIYVKKFMEPNPFLRGEAASLPPAKLNTYLQAHVSFNGSETYRNTPAATWSVDKSKHAVLSSGGKDSLLSFGLLRELGREVHPVFINESGRHWYTALNAFRHFEQSYPDTARVWTNADRIFAWMLRLMPFIRRDFASLRSDEYPIRLWTVAVFVFGALPLLHKRGAGRLVIGDEFDTTRRLSYKGIPHYDGLFDQSRYFDNALSRYFRRKGWNISQFSIVRPLSEILIEKILVERYPQLQQHQVSCHAAHIEGERIKPCGRCEKCRRIVGMLIALGADPSRCGYTNNQVEQCLSALARSGVHQESAGVQQLNYLLAQKGVIDASALSPGALRERPEIMKVRIDPERSPVEAVPPDLRKALYRIFLEHSDGSAKRIGRTWKGIKILEDVTLARPYLFESPVEPYGGGRSTGGEKTVHKTEYKLWELTWPEAEKRFKEVDVGLLPVGSLEQHGRHLPMDTDAFDAQHLAKEVASRCSNPKPLVFPLIPYGVSYHHEDFRGTVSITNDSLTKIAYDIGMSAARNGITKLVIINGHGGNVPALRLAAQMINRDAQIFTCVETGETSDADIAQLIETPNDVHAGEIETSTSLATRPQLVQMDKAKKFVPKFSSRFLNFSSKRSVEWYAQTVRISRNGVLGDPTKASREKGKKIWKVMIDNLVEFVEHLKNIPLSEIYERRY